MNKISEGMKFALFGGSIGSIVLVLFGVMDEKSFDLSFKIVGFLAIAYFVLKNEK